MADDHRLLWLWTAPELLALVAVFGLLVASLLGTQPVFVAELAAVSRPFRVAGAAFVAVELLIPVWVAFDLRRHHRGTDVLWVHIAAMPGLNLVGLLAYRQERGRLRSTPEPGTDCNRSESGR